MTFHRALTLCIFSVILLLGPKVFAQANRPYYMMDRRVVDRADGVQLDVSPPVKAGPVLKQERPWESFYMQPLSMVRGNNGEYLLYYFVYVTNDGPNRGELCLATSSDGLVWKRPDLGQVAYAGSKANNILDVGGTIGVVNLNKDPNAVPDQRYLLMGPDAITKFGEPGYVRDGLALFASPDGRVWKQVTRALTPFTADSANQVFFDTMKEKYVVYLRAFPGHRAIAYYEPPSLLKPWPIRPEESNKGEIYNSPQGPVHVVYIQRELPLVIDGDRAMQVYNPAVQPLQGMYIALPDIFRIFPGPNDPDKQRFPDSELFAWPNDGFLAPRLYVSEDGQSFRPVGTKPYIDLGYGSAENTKQVRMAVGFIDHGDEIWQYYGGQRTGHTLARGRRPREGSTVMRAVQRKDGFAAMIAGPEGGQILTAPVTCDGQQLLVNYDAGAWGEVRVELLDDHAEPIPGYSLADSAPLVGNVVYGPVLWADRRDLRPLNGRRLRIRFHLRGARLFSFKFR